MQTIEVAFLHLKMCLLTITILGGAVTLTLIGHDTMNIIILLRLTKVALTQFDILLSMSKLANSQLKRAGYERYQTGSTVDESKQP